MVMEKVSTGLSGLDKILKGGYLKNKATLLKGGPGSGKTIFTLFFAHAQIMAGERVIFVTCDESPDQIIKHMDGFGLNGSKYRASGKLFIVDFTKEMPDEVIGEFDLNAILLRIEQAKDTIKANTLIIDSLQAILLGLVNYYPGIELHNLFSWVRDEQLTVLCTVAADVSLFQTVLYEEYIVDCAIELSQQLKNNLMTRYLRVVKLRGSAHGTNEYPFAIIHNNISLIPINETRLVNFNLNKYISTGIEDLDRMLGNKGYKIGSSLMLSGCSGTGKTIFAASLAKEALLNKNKVLLITFEESPSGMIQHLQSAGIDLSPYLKNKKLMIDARRSTEMGLEDHIISFIDLANSGNFDFIVLNPVSSLLDLGNTMDLKMLFGSKKTEMMLNEKERLHQNQEKIKHLDRELKALNEELEARQLLRKTEFIIKENALLDKKQQIMNQRKQIRALEKSSKHRRD